ncbi:Porin, Gram-negative type [Cupriavidus taiwanensis]|uniref:porin n=1 Tax=Cupriavidus taiwanensis TaxID=164546 RepID=UPI000E18C08E|nr:porin [Cupriavidus taiwanensis]SOY94629.1 Porin, Gram-negative type [Cupriavidus taiwanensis]SOY98699.1 Porin, Gram-negative type [Cupriavidus taiwanensis]
MRKSASLWLLAGAVLPAVSYAQSSLTLYGVISTAVRYTSNIDGRHHDQGELVSSGIGGSRWGLKGDEDLGGGNRAVFLLENGFGTDDGKTAYSALFGRQAYVGLSGDWGTLTFGRQYNALNNIAWSFDPLDQGWGNFWSDPLYTGGDIFFQGYRVNNSVVYKKKVGPVSVQLDYGFGERPGSMARGATFGGGVMYQDGPLALGVAYDQQRPGSGDNTLHNYSVGASYVIGKATGYAGYMGRRETNPDARFWIAFVGLGYQLTPALHLSGAYYRYQQSGTVTTQFQATPLVLGSGNADAISAVADYALSKRTSLFLEADATFARGGTVGRETEYWAGTPVTDVRSTTRVGVMAGVRHVF